MVIIHGQSKRKATGGRFTNTNPKRLRQKGSLPTATKVGKQDVRAYPNKANSVNRKILSAEKINVFDPKTKKHSVATVKSVEDSSANRHFVRRNIITKGCVIETNKGKAKITSRPGQEGSINAVLVQE